MPQDVDPSSDLPKFAEAMRRAYTHTPAIPPAVDRRISEMAPERFAQRRRSRMTIGWVAAAAAATGLAAVIALAIVLRPSPPPTSVARTTPKAFNMVDALVLARHIAAHDKVDKSADVNGDGVVDQRDVDAIAAAAVTLKQPVAHRLPTLNELGLRHPLTAASVDTTDSTKSVAQAETQSRGVVR